MFKKKKVKILKLCVSAVCINVKGNVCMIYMLAELSVCVLETAGLLLHL